MLRLLIISGLFLMAAGFGAAGWQYWQGVAADNPEVARRDASPGTPGQSWLISASGTPVPRAEADAFLAQERLVPTRRVTLTRTARLADLLAPGEKLPDEPYLQVLADIRAPLVADPLCQVLTERIAQACAVNSARVIEGSVDPVQGMAGFRIELVYRLLPDAAELPDLATHVVAERVLELEVAADRAGTPDAALGAALDAALGACAEAGTACRLMEIDLDLMPEAGPPSGRARIAWLARMPAGMLVVPPLAPKAGD